MSASRRNNIPVDVSLTPVDFDPFATGPSPVAAPSTEAQQEIWTSARMGPGASCAFNQSLSVWLRGALDVPALQWALQELVQRHDALRASFSADGTMFNVASSLILHAPLVDCSEQAGSDGDAELAALVEREVAEPFDPVNGPLVRATIVRVTARVHLLLFTAHHLVCDGWSVGVLLQELGALYSAARQGCAPDVPAPMRFSDFAYLQAQQLGSSAYRDAETYWLRQFADPVAQLELPADHARPSDRSFNAAREERQIDGEVVAGLGELGARAGCAFFTTLLAAFKAFLYRLSGQEDIVVGIPAPGQALAGWENLVGHCVNLLPLRSRVSGNDRFSEVLTRVREGLADAYDHRDYTFGTLVKKLRLGREPGRIPLTSIVFNGEREIATLGFDGLEVSYRWNRRRFENFEVHVNAVERQGGLVLECTYNTDLFDAGTIQRRLEEFEVLLAGIVALPDERVATLPMLPAADGRRLLEEWNATEQPVSRGLCIHELVEGQARRGPGAPAVVADDGQLAYEELDRRANQLAHYLQRCGVGPDVVVGVCLERSSEMVVAWLGTLKAGGAYLPLDPSYPEARLRFMIQDSGMQVLLTRDGLLRLPPDPELKTVRLNVDGKIIGEESVSPPHSGATPEHLAYVIYTSGSTGGPKGVEISHAGLVNLVSWHQRAYGVTAGDRATQLAALGFDASVWEIWPYLATGASVHMAPDDERSSPSRLMRWLAEQGITICFLPTALTEAVLREPLPDGLALRAVLTGGDRLHRGPSSRIPFQLFNHYGPTEYTVVTTAAPVTEGEACPPIGRPIANTRVYLLDAELQPVPIGVPGELFVGGAGLARGYRNRPELTSQRFVPDPFSGAPGARLYRTGDQARYRSDGNIEFLGRLDHQVKVRGFRVELGEIEQVLVAHDAVLQAATVLREDRPGDARLVAYVVVAPNREVSSAALRSYLHETLPQYMVPQHIIVLDALPITPGGKVDRRSLAAPGHSLSEPAADFVPPRTRTEKQLGKIWQQALGIDRVSLYDKFFDVGGHSLLAMSVISEVEQRLNHRFRMIDLARQTLGQLAAACEHSPRVGNDQQPAHLLRRARNDAPGQLLEVPLTEGQQEIWLSTCVGPEANCAFNLANRLCVRGSLDVAALREAVQRLVTRHEALRTTIRSDGAVQRVLPQVTLALPLVDLLGLAPAERDMRLAELERREVETPFDLEQGPLIRTTLVRVGEEEHLLFMTVHHIICDGWSCGVIVRELGQLYSAVCQGEAPDGGRVMQFAEYAAAAVQREGSAERQATISYWLNQFKDSVPVLELPTDRQRPPVRTYRAQREQVALQPELVRQLERECARQGVTLFTLLMAAFEVLLHRVTGQDDIVMGISVAGQPSAGDRNLVGHCVSLLPLRLQAREELPFGDHVQLVKGRMLEAFEHRDFSFGTLVKGLRMPRHPNRVPVVSVVFNMESALQGVAFHGLDVEVGFSRSAYETFELFVNVIRTDAGATVECAYNVDLFDAATIRCRLEEFATLLASICEAPQTPIGTMRLLPASEWTRVVEEWNATTHAYPVGERIHTLFERQVERTPEREAVVCGGERLSYAEVNRRANLVAARLRVLGVGPESLVGLCVERSVDVVVGALGILKAGGAYVPLDPAYPAERIAFIAQDADMVALVTQERLLEALPTLAVPLVCLDRDWAAIAAGSEANPGVRVEGGHLAYVIYTSGSTGTPKGVAIEHRSTVALLWWAHSVFTEEELAGVLASTSICFDLSVFELFVPLTAGGKVVLVENALALPATPLASEVTLVNTVPSAMDELLRGGAGLPPNVVTVNLAGEVLTVELVRRIYASGRVERVYDLYGPSEDTTYSTWALRTADGPYTIGRPIANTQAYVLDEQMQPVPIGVIGELYLGGAGLARGYLHRPELTAERFVANPFDGEGGSRLYRTGDLARYGRDGNLELVGRMDTQVKLRGFRIELGEIEAVLEGHDGVRRAVVVVREDKPGDKRLAAYVVLEDGARARAAVLREYLRERLPQYMVPQHFVELTTVPMTPNGKVDRKALPAPEAGDTRSDDGFVPPESASERALAAIWQEVLGTDRVGRYDNFFDMGGHSLLAVRAVHQIEEAVGHRFTLLDLGRQTLGQLATVCDQVVAEDRKTRTPLLQRAVKALSSMGKGRLP